MVANEVQKLGRAKPGGAAREIEDLSKASVGIAEQAGLMLEKLVPDIQKTADLVTEIHAASTEQASGVLQINTAIQQLNTVVQENAASSEQLASTSEELASQAFSMREAVVRLKTGRSVGQQAPAPVRAVRPANAAPGAVRKSLPSRGATIALNPGDKEDENFERL